MLWLVTICSYLCFLAFTPIFYGPISKNYVCKKVTDLLLFKCPQEDKYLKEVAVMSCQELIQLLLQYLGQCNK